MELLKITGLNKLLIIPGILFLLLIAGLSTAPAEDKTPPYTGWKPEGSFQPFRETSPEPAKTVPSAPAPAVKPFQGRPAEISINTENYQTEEYVVQEGDWIAKILREKGVLEGQNLSELLEMLRKFNQSMQDFNLIKPGEKIVILVKVESSPKAEKPLAPKQKVEREKKVAPKKPPAPEKELAAETPVPLKTSHIRLSETKSVSTIQQLKSESYRIQPGDILSMIVMHRYDLSSRTFMAEYLDLFKKCNPSIEDPDRLFPGQKVSLPLYPPQWYDVPPTRPAQPPIMRDLASSSKVRLPDPKPIAEPMAVAEPEKTTAVEVHKTPETRPKTWFSKKKAVTKNPKISETPEQPKKVTPTEVLPQIPVSSDKAPEKAPLSASTPPETTYTEPSWQSQQNTAAVSKGLGDIFPRMGEKWIHSGEHFIPMKSGGHINLKADTYPIIKLHGGITLIVDLYNSLPPRMGRVIESSWGTYQIVHLSPADDLKSAFDKILKAVSYPKVFKEGEPLKLSGTIPVSITADWIVIPPRGQAGKGPGFIVVNLLDDPSQGVPPSIKAYLKSQGVLFVEYPSAQTSDKPLEEKTPETAPDAASLVEMLLTLTGHPHDAKVKIPAFESQNDDFKLTVTADFYLTANGRERVIDLSGLNPEIVALLKERGISVLSLSKDKDPLTVASKTLKFLDWQYKMGPHTLSTAPQSKKNVNLVLSGVIFFTEGGHSVFMTPLDLPPEVALFLYGKGYRVVTLAAFTPGAGTKGGWGG